ncbi:MAG: mucin desulfatase, partial [Oscillospiraceae bacterium]
MDREYACSRKQEAIANFVIEGKCIESNPYGNGHINDTFLLRCKDESGKESRYVLQRMNHEVFKSPEELVENISGVTSHIKAKIIANGSDYMRETLNMIGTLDKKFYYKDSIGYYWRMYYFIADATCFDLVEDPEYFYQSGVAFGNFQKLLSDYPAEKLHETIVDFHNTKKRYETFLQAVKEDKLGRAKDVQAEIDFIMAREGDTVVCTDMLAKGELPLRVTHNDTKLNNVMI